MSIGFFATHDFSQPSAKAFHIIEILKELENVKLAFYEQDEYLDDFKEVLDRDDVEYLEVEKAGVVPFNSGVLNITRFFMDKEVDVIFIKNSMLNTLPILVKKKVDVPLVLEVHGDLRHEMSFQKRKLRYIGLVIEKVQKKNMEVADRVSFISQKVRERHPEVPDSKSAVIENAAEKEFLEDYKDLDKYEDPTVTYIGNLAETKGVLKIPEIAEKIPEVKFKIVGGGHLKEDIENAVSEKDLKNVDLTGWLDREKALEIVAKSHISLMPYPEYFENYFSPFKLFESMAVGTPAVSTPSGEPARIIREEDCGEVCGDFTIGNIVDCLESLLEDDERRSKYRENGIKAVEGYYNWERFGNQMKQLVNEVS